MSEQEIKERASDKVFAKIISLENEIIALNRDIDKKMSGGITIEQLHSILDYTESEIIIWRYIASLTEKDNKL